ncbi:galactokinase [bacterium]|nr:galactokinase [candidate division CSSED10-310 bacterium]
MAKIEPMLELHRATFPDSDSTIIHRFAPGRLNLIGEHTDYNDGFVLPMPLRLGITALSSRMARGVKLFSAILGESIAVDLDQVSPGTMHGWSAYPLGVLKLCRDAGAKIPGLAISFHADLPAGAGLSSSAALEVATLRTVSAYTELPLDPIRQVELCRQAEHEFAGVRCGIMDQMVSHLGKPGRAMYLDCRSLAFQMVPWRLRGISVVIIESGVRHALRESGYNRRRLECMEATEQIKATYPAIRNLRDADQAMVSGLALRPELARRVRHVVSENQRVREAVAALRDKDGERFGALVNASHDSLRDDYEVSCPEIDCLVEAARAQRDCLGARMIGGGFGGSVMILVKQAATGETVPAVLAGYARQTGRIARAYKDIIEGDG